MSGCASKGYEFSYMLRDIDYKQYTISRSDGSVTNAKGYAKTTSGTTYQLLIKFPIHTYFNEPMK